MRDSLLFETIRGHTTSSYLYFVLLIACISIAVCGYAAGDIQEFADNSPIIMEPGKTNSSVHDIFGPDLCIVYPEDRVMNHIARILPAGNEFAEGTSTNSPALSIREENINSDSLNVNATDLQLTWQKCLGGSSYDAPIKMIQTSDGGYLIGGYTYSNDGDISGYHGGLDFWIVKLDSSRNMVWQRCMGGSNEDFFKSVIQTIDGGYLIYGHTGSTNGDVSGNHGNYDIWEVKLDLTGNIIWQKCLGGTGYDNIQSVIQTADGGYLVSGFTRSTDGDVSGQHGAEDIWLVKQEPAGNITWQKCFGGTNYDAPTSVIQTVDGGYLVTGCTTSIDGDVTGNHGDYDIWVIQLDSLGNNTWQKCLGGTSTDFSYTTIKTTDGGYLLSGYTCSTDGDVTGNHGQEDIWEVKLDSEGNITWQKCFGGISDEQPNAGVIQTTDGGYLVSGYTNSYDSNVTGNHGEDDIWELKLNSSGNMIWQKCLGGSSSEYPQYVYQTSDDGYLIGGYTMSSDGDVSINHGSFDIWVVKMDSGGNMVWQKCLGGPFNEEPSAGIIQTTDGRYLISGNTLSSEDDVAGNHGGIDIWLALLKASHPVTATSDSWTIAYPPGTTLYGEGTNATYLAQAKPGANLVHVSVDNEQVGPLTNWTFSLIATNHTFATVGQPTPGQVHAFFSLNTSWGTVPLTVQFTNQSVGNPSSFSWNFGDGSSSTEENPIHTFMTPGTYSVSLQASNADSGGIATLTHALTATDGFVPSPTPTPVPGEITAAFSADSVSGSAPMLVSFVDLSTGNPTSWLWNLGDGTIAESQNLSHLYTTKGTYSVTLTAQNSISSASIEKSGYIVVT